MSDTDLSPLAGPSGATPVNGYPYPTPDDTVDVPRDLAALAMALDPQGTVPVGGVMLWAAAAAPTGWLLMQGQQVAAATYPGLATVLGQTGGNVTIPDLRDTFPVGAGATIALGGTGGAAAVALSVAQMPGHNHNGATGAADRSLAHTHTRESGIPANYNFGYTQGAIEAARGTDLFGVNSLSGGTSNSPAPDHLHAIAAQGGNATHENRPPYRGINFIIRAG